MRNNIIKAIFHGNTTVCKTAPVYQGDYGLVMQITHPDLPSVYEVHFANAPQGTATTQIGGADGVSVPDVYLTTGHNLYAWVFLHTGESDGETTLTITTPVIRKGAVSDQPAPPEQQSVITEAIAVLNHAVETTGQDVIDAGIAKTAAETAQGKAEDAQTAAEAAQRLAEGAKTGAEAAQAAAETAQGKAEDAQEAAEAAQAAAEAARDRAEAATVHEPKIGDDGYWYVWDQNEEVYVKTDTKAQGEGPSDYSALSNKPKINSVELTGNKSLSDLGAAAADDVAAKYTKPQTGIPKTDLASDVQASLGKADTALQTSPVTSVNGQTGAVTIAVPAIDDTLTQAGDAADAKAVGDEIEELKSGLQTLEDDLDDKLDAPATAGTNGQVLTSDGQGGQSWQTPSGGGSVTDVRLAGNSITSNGVADILTGTAYGLTTEVSSGKRYLKISTPTDANVKSGNIGSISVTLNKQHAAAFYGLAKAAGVDLANETVTLGTYTDAAKVAIQKMLGIYQAPWELIREDTFLNETEADHTITVDSNGEEFDLTDVIVLFETPKNETVAASVGSSGAIDLYYNRSGNTLYFLRSECGSYTQAANTSAHGCNVKLTQKDNMLSLYKTANITVSNSGNVGMRYTQGFNTELINSKNSIAFALLANPITIQKVIIRSVTGTGHYILYGKRKWWT